MAIVHREPNQVKWVGVRPGHNGEQVVKWGDANNNLVVLYTVPADKLLLIFGYFISYHGSVAGYGYLDVYTAVPAIWKRLYGGAVNVGEDFSATRDYSIPIEVPATYTVRVQSTVLGCYIDAGIDGILIDV